MNAYWAYARMSVRSELRYFFDLMLGGMGSVITATFTILFWYTTGQQLFFGVFSWGMLVWYLIIVQLLCNTQKNFTKDISDHIQTGLITSIMSRPVFYPLALLADHIGEVVIIIPAVLLLLIPLGFIAGGSIQVTFVGVIIGIISIFLAILLQSLIDICLGMIAFWVEDANPYRWVFQKMVFLLGGVIFPLEIYPQWFQPIAKIQPIAYTMYHPSKLFVNFSLQSAIDVLAGQIIYCVAFGLLLAIMYSRAVRKVNINGG